jgi:Lon-like protease
VRQRIVVALGACLLVAVVVALNWYRLPVVALTPGPAEDVLPRIKVEGRTPVYDSAGHLYLTSVGIDDDVRFYEALLDLADHDVQLEPRAALYPKGQSVQQVDQQNADDMTASKTDAAVVALRQLGYRVDPVLVQIEAVQPGTPARGRLDAGDQLVSVGGQKVTSGDDVHRALDRFHVGDTVPFTVRRQRREVRVDVPTTSSPDRPGRPFVGVALEEVFHDLPVSISIDTENIGGPSAGLMFALAIIDKLTPGDLTGGRRIAGTGELLLDGTVFRIGGIGEKLVAARRQGATIFLVPGDNCAEARRVAPRGLRLVRVDTVAQALDFLRQDPAHPAARNC